MVSGSHGASAAALLPAQLAARGSCTTSGRRLTTILRRKMPEDLSLISRLRALPSVDALLRTPDALALRERLGAARLTELARAVTEELRAELLALDSQPDHNGRTDAPSTDAAFSREALLAEVIRRLGARAEREEARGLRRVINATGVVLHTNLGRAPLSGPARERVSRAAAGYCTLEYDAETGRRGRRGERAESLLAELTGAEEALVVNNCAAAALLVLTALSRGGEAVISRGELVEIGGDFRVPEVMAQSGATMVEVGTTNRTRLADYERALNEQTRLVVRVHPSNYRLVGFTSAPALAELAALAHAAGLPLYEDAGSGALIDLAPYGITGEPVIGESIAAGADLVTFSGDKLLGSAQAGLIVGRSEWVNRLRRHPLYRALRADKLTLAALEATLEAYRRGEALAEIPALRMLSVTAEELERRARDFAARLRTRLNTNALELEVIAGHSAVGGGSAPTAQPRTSLVALKHESLSADALDAALRRSRPPVVARILDDRVVLDPRTIGVEEENELLDALAAIVRA
jgi:L-seryl-tRNA(Ser) seleniumtransferase